MRIRPALIGGPATRVPALWGQRNDVSPASPTTVFSGGGAGFNTRFSPPNVNNTTTEHYFRFAALLSSPLILFKHGSTDVGSTGGIQLSIAAAGSGSIDLYYRCYAMTQDWDPATLTWNTKPTLTGLESYIDWRINIGDTTTPASASMSAIGKLQTTGNIYGLMMRPTWSGSATTPNSASFVLLPSILNFAPAVTIPVSARESTGTTRKLTFASPHGIKKANAFGGGIVIAGVGTDYDAGGGYTLVPISNIPSTTTLEYTNSPSLSESLTSCGGSISFY